MPAYRAAKTLKLTYENIPHDIVDSIILVDDASEDNTVEKSKDLELNGLGMELILPD